MEEVCRVCSNRSSNLVNLFVKRESEEEEEKLPSPAEMLNECTDCRITQNDPLPKEICETCLLAAKCAFRLKQRCQQNLQSLIDLSDVCCVCRSSSITRMDIFEKRQRLEGEFSLAEMMDECLGTETTSSKSVTSRICLSCVLAVKDTFKFKRKCEQNNLLLTDNKQTEEFILPDNNIDVNIKLEKEDNTSQDYRSTECDVKCEVTESREINGNVKKERNEKQEASYEETLDTDESLPSDRIITEDACQNEFLCGNSNSLQDTSDCRKPSINNKFACNICGKILPSWGRLVRHERNHTNTIEQPFQCTHCPNKYTRKKCLEIHLSKHGKNIQSKPEIVYQCSYCPRTFALSISLRNHQRVHTTEGPFKCPECPKSFASNFGLLDHSRIHTGKDNHMQDWESGESFVEREDYAEESLKLVGNKEQKEFVACELDEVTLDTDESLMSDSLIKEETCLIESFPETSNSLNDNAKKPYIRKTFPCDICGKTFNRPGCLTIHKRNHTGERPYKCPDCPKSFISAGTLSNHMISHSGERQFNCQYCPKVFSHQNSLRVHMYVHSGEYPYQCSQCNKSFGQKGDLSNHIRTHSQERPYKCSHCTKTFTRKDSLAFHTRTHTGEKPHKCPQCPMTFSRKDTLTVHLRVHTGEKPFKCPHCPSEYRRKTSLELHLATHDPRKPQPKPENVHQCPDCPKCFTRKDSLEYHIRVHTGEQPYECPHCPMTFSRKQNLGYHIRKHTGEQFECPHCENKYTHKSTLNGHMLIHEKS